MKWNIEGEREIRSKESETISISQKSLLLIIASVTIWRSMRFVYHKIPADSGMCITVISTPTHISATTNANCKTCILMCTYYQLPPFQGGLKCYFQIDSKLNARPDETREVLLSFQKQTLRWHFKLGISESISVEIESSLE